MIMIIVLILFCLCICVIHPIILRPIKYFFMDDHKRRIERAYKKGFPIQYRLKKCYGLFLRPEEYIWFDLMYSYSCLENLDWNSFEYRINQPHSSLDMGNDEL